MNTMIKSVKKLSFLSSLICTSLIITVGGISEQANAANITGVKVIDLPLKLEVTWEWDGKEIATLKPPTTLKHWIQGTGFNTNLRYNSDGTVELISLRYTHKEFTAENHKHNKINGKSVEFDKKFIPNTEGDIDQTFQLITEHLTEDKEKHFDGYTVNFNGKSFSGGGTLRLTGLHGNNRVEVPEPLTILGSLTALGLGITLKKRQKQVA